MVVKHFKGDFEKIFKDTEKDRNKIAREGLGRLCNNPYPLPSHNPLIVPGIEQGFVGCVTVTGPMAKATETTA